jgi:tryptophan synthase alpha chain
MTRIGRAFDEAARAGRPAFVAFLTAGDPSLDRVEEIAVSTPGIDVLELGVPFSDPLADGPVIQRSTERALGRGTTLPKVLELARRIRTRSEVPLVLFSYLNPLLKMGLEVLAREAASAGVDGVLVTDLPPEEASAWTGIASGTGLDTVFLAAPTTSAERLQWIASCSRGFVYAVSRTGVTGERDLLSEDAAPLTGRVRALTRTPVALGFGISSPGQVKAAARVADGVVVGSALVRFLEGEPHGNVREFLAWLKSEL